MSEKKFEKISSPEDIKNLDYRQLELLSGKIRQFLIEKVSHTGGHLSSNLGMVELTLALHYCFNSPTDKIVFDVGHQCYTHKILTGRAEGFDKLRQLNGVSGFPHPNESEHDLFVVGHSGTSISSAVGLARAKKIKGEDGYVIAVIGDGAFTGGLVYEGLTNATGLDNLIVILNDNKMSISKNSGSLAQYLTKLRTNEQYYKAKADVKNVLGSSAVGSGIKSGIQSAKSFVRRKIYHSTFFEELGFNYIGPVNGHSIEELCAIFTKVNLINKPLFVYTETIKGKGFVPAENNPGAFHGVSAFNMRRLNDPDVSGKNTFSAEFGKNLVKLAEQNKSICAITAAMKYGTGLQYIKKSFPERFFDVGIAEEHAVTFAAGLAKGGLLPLVCIYSTFLQRSYDQIIHDVMLQNLNVIFAVDRAGLVPNDGETHQGIFDAAFFSQHSKLPVFSPSNYAELSFWLDKLTNEYEGPRVLRYPRGAEPQALTGYCSGNLWDCIKKTKSQKLAIISYGSLTAQLLETEKILTAEKVNAAVYKMVQINPIDVLLRNELLSYKNIVFVEEGIKQGGIGEHLLAALFEAGYKGNYLHIALPEKGIPHASTDELKEHLGFSANGIAKSVREFINEKAP